MRFRKKPVEVDAVEYTGKLEDLDGFCPKVNGRHLPFLMTPEFAGLNAAHETGSPLFIPTPEGVMMTRVGDFIIRGVKDELYPCKPDIFAATYERVKGEDYAQVNAADAAATAVTPDL